MLRNRFLEFITTKYLISTITIILIFIIGVVVAVLGFQIVRLDELTKIVDVVFKATAILLGFIWTLNRYYVGRTDNFRLKVDSDIKTVWYPENVSNFVLLIFRLDVINTSSVLIDKYQQSLKIHSVTPSSSGILYKQLYRFPDKDKHIGKPIEPNSWAAINDAISIPEDVRAVRIYIEIEFAEGDKWTWHKTFDVSGGKVEK